MTTPEQDVLITNWVAALRSGKYQQCITGDLVQDFGYCCLGVAGHLIGLTDEVMHSGKGDSYWEIRDAYGLKTQLGHFNIDDVDTNLAYENDKGLSFSKIADIIESRPEGLFV